MIIKQIKLSQKEKEKLIRLKAKTGISAWNVLCRWAFCVSLADPSVPFGPDVPSDSNVEMSWSTFGGDYHEVYEALIQQRCIEDSIGDSPNQIIKYFRLHLQRGINTLSAKTGPRDIIEFASLIESK